MALEKKAIARKFSITIGSKTTDLPDPNPALSIDAVKEMYSNTYPELLNSKTNNKGFINDNLVIEFTTVAGTKG